MDSDPPVFAALLTPHRSLGRVGIRHVVVAYAFLAAVPGAYALATGAWPIVWMLSLAALGLWFALRFSLKTGDTFEEVTLFRHELTVRHVAHDGVVRRHAFNPFWVRFDIARDHADRVTRMTLRHRSESLEIGAFLTPNDKARFAHAFREALHRTKN